MEVIKVSDELAVIKKLAQLVEKSAEKAKNENVDGIFRIGLSGGSLVRYMSEVAGQIKTDWSKWKLFFCDERYVTDDNPDSTFGQYVKEFLPKTSLTKSQFLTIDTNLELQDCAHAYEQLIYKEFDIQDLDFKTIPKFDLLLLGMGPDGHTCSLFPNHPLLNEDQVLIAKINDSPKPPPERVTMTYRMINNARTCLFAISGAGKADMIKRILVDKEQLPATLVKPIDGNLIWILDEAAGKSVV